MFIADLLSTVEFNDTGEFLATGDRGGRIVIFEKGEDIKQVIEPYNRCVAFDFC